MKRYIRKEREPNLTHYTNTNTKHLQNHTKHERQDPVYCTKTQKNISLHFLLTSFLNMALVSSNFRLNWKLILTSFFVTNTHLTTSSGVTSTRLSVIFPFPLLPFFLLPFVAPLPPTTPTGAVTAVVPPWVCWAGSSVNGFAVTTGPAFSPAG